MTPEQRERAREYARKRYAKLTPEQRERERVRKNLIYDSPNRPDSYTPKWVGREIRVRTILAGWDPGSPVGIAAKAAELAMENPDLGGSYLCGYYLVKYANNLCVHWRRMSPKAKDSIYAEVESRRVQESQPSNATLSNRTPPLAVEAPVEGVSSKKIDFNKIRQLVGTR